MVRVTEFLIALVLIGFFAVAFGLFMAEVSTTYGVDYDNDSFETYNQLNTLHNLSRSIEEGSVIEERTGVLDLVGSYISDAYNALLLTKQSATTFDTMTTKALQDSQIAGKDYLKVTIMSIISILIVVGVLISAIMKWRL